jgi:cytochrome c oxidase subunit 4
MTDRRGEHEGEAAHERGHASVRTYVAVAAVLTGVTAIEVAATYVQTLTPILVPTLLLLSLAKFALVVLFFMHLRYDSRVLGALFGAPLVIAIAIVLALAALIRAVMVRM